MTDQELTARAVVDRVTDGVAVLLVGDDQVERHLPLAELPDGCGEGSWLLVVDGSSPRVVDVDHEGEEQARARNRSRLASLRRKRSTGRFPSR